MSAKTLPLDDRLLDYLRSVGFRDHDVLRRLRAATAGMPRANMQISPEQGGFLQFLVRVLGARRTIEVGTFTGYSALCVALGLPDEGRVVALDLSREWTDIARQYWKEAQVDHKIYLRLGDATEGLDRLIDEGGEDRHDFAFIDADKEGYDGYYERCLKLVRPGGVIAFDNVLWGGSVVNPDKQDPDTRAIRALNEKLHRDERVDVTLVPIGDGLTLARRR